MDSIEAMVAIAQLRLRLALIERCPDLLEKMMTLKIRKPIELAGLKTQLIRAEAQEKAIGGLSKRYNVVQDEIDELIGAHAEHAGDLEQYAKDLRAKIEGMVGSNGGDPFEGGQTGQGSGQVISSETPKA